MKPPLKDLQNAIAETIAAEEKAYDVSSMCSFLGLEIGGSGDPMSSKRIYVLSLIKPQIFRNKRLMNLILKFEPLSFSVMQVKS